MRETFWSLLATFTLFAVLEQLGDVPAWLWAVVLVIAALRLAAAIVDWRERPHRA